MESLSHQSRILLAEDCPDTQRVLQFMLEQTGAEVVLANNGEECVEKVHDGDFQLIVLDVKMPILDGVEALREIRRDGFLNPVIALTASPSEDVKLRMEALGIEAYLSKLSDRKNIMSSVNTALEKAESRSKSIPLPVLPVYPEAFPETREDYDRLMQFLDHVHTVGQKLKYAMKRQAYKELEGYVNELGGASLYGYQILATELERLVNALSTDKSDSIHSQAGTVHRLLLGILAGRKKIEKKAGEEGLLSLTVH